MFSLEKQSLFIRIAFLFIVIPSTINYSYLIIKTLNVYTFKLLNFLLSLQSKISLNKNAILFQLV